MSMYTELAPSFQRGRLEVRPEIMQKKRRHPKEFGKRIENKKPDVSKFSRQQLLDFIRSKTGEKLRGTVTKFEDPFESPVLESDWGFDKEL